MTYVAKKVGARWFVVDENDKKVKERRKGYPTYFSKSWSTVRSAEAAAERINSGDVPKNIFIPID